jgi:hypothetical protein
LVSVYRTVACGAKRALIRAERLRHRRLRGRSATPPLMPKCRPQRTINSNRSAVPTSTLTSALKNEHTKRILHVTGIRRPSLTQRRTPHYRMPKLVANGGYLLLKKYDGPEIPKSEYEDLAFTTYASDQSTVLAPITSATGEIELRGFEAYGRPDLDGIWTDNAKKCPTIVSYVESIGARFGRVQLLKMQPNTIRECRWGLHLDNNNAVNVPDKNGWVVRVWLELTDDESSSLVVRSSQFDKNSETRIALPRYQQAVVDSELLYHGGYHRGPGIRYALIVSLESGPALEKWVDSQLPEPAVAPAG